MESAVARAQQKPRANWAYGNSPDAMATGSGTPASAPVIPDACSGIRDPWRAQAEAMDPGSSFARPG
jgi:hypothetical protein